MLSLVPIDFNKMLYSSRLLFLSLFGLYILSTAAGISSDQHDIIIELHKKLRENHKKTVGLKWDALLAFQSKQYVKKCDYNSAKDSSKISELLAVDNVASGYKDCIKQSMLGIETINTMTMIIQATQMLQPHLSRWFGKIPNELVVPLKTALAAYYTIAYTHLVYLSI